MKFSGSPPRDFNPGRRLVDAPPMLARRLTSLPTSNPSTTGADVVGIRADPHRARAELGALRRLGVLGAARAAFRAVLLDRSTRVRILLAAVIAMSFVDLDMTLVYARTTGMVEHNPIAREIMSTGSVWLLILWKLVTVSIAVVLLNRVRRHASGELGAWLCMGVLCWLTVRWVDYNDEIAVLQFVATSPAVRADPKFVMIPDQIP